MRIVANRKCIEIDGITSAELYVDEDRIKGDIGALLLKLESVQAEQIDQLTQPRLFS
jgi:hypothetical protein